MENASKALIIVGGILLALALISFGIYTYISIRNVQEAQDLKTSQEQLVKFNKKYEAYNKEIMYGADVITVILMAEEDRNRGIDIKVFVDGTQNTRTNVQFGPNGSVIDSRKSEIYRCSNIIYNHHNNRITEIYFVRTT